MLRVKNNLPEGTIAAALVNEATEENSSESNLFLETITTAENR
jgi:hypothetical protein